jgi:methylenetetrahydrofolate reductase (NADPH)
VYQKEYLEFFCSPENKDKLLAEMVNFPTLSYHVVNAKGESVANTKGTAAVTWGVFPGKVLLLLPSRLPLCPV